MEYKLVDIISEIEKRRDALLLIEQNELEQSRIDYFNDFFEKYSGKRITSLGCMRPREILLAYLLLQNQLDSFEELEEKVSEIDDFIEKIDEMTFNTLAIIALEITSEKIQLLQNLDEELTNNRKAGNIFYLKKQLNKIIKNDHNQFKINSINPEDFICFIKLLLILKKINNDDYFVFISFIYSLKRLQTVSDVMALTFDSEEDDETYINFMLKNNTNRKEIEKSLEPLYKYYLSLEKAQNQFSKEKNKKLYRYTELLELLKREDEKEEITCVDIILDKILEDDLKLLCLKYIDSHNNRYYQELEKQYLYKSENSITKYISYFNNIGIDFKNYSQSEQEKIMLNSVDELKKKVKLLSSVYDNKEKCVIVSINTQLSVIKEIDQLLKNGYINSDLLNQADIYCDNSIFVNLKNNIEYVLGKGINLISVENKDFLLTDNSLLINNIIILENLGIDFNMLKNFEMLKETNLQQKINSLIEVGLEELLKTKPNVLNSDINLAKRVIIARLVGEDIFDNDDIKTSILDKDSFFVANDMIDSYLFDRNNTNYQNTNIIGLDKAIESNMSYCIEGIIIPKARIANLCVSLESIVRPSLYTKEEVKVLEKYIKVEK